LSPSWYQGCIWDNFRLHLPTYRGKSLAFILADIRAIIAACLADDGVPDNGALQVTTSTSGDDPDPDGYTFAVDGGTSQAIGTNGVVTEQDLTPGDHQVLLGGIAANCSVGGDNPRTVGVPSGATAQTTFNITCEALPPTVGELDVVTTTGGVDLDPDGYSVSVGGGAGNPTGVEDTLSFPGLTPGDYEVQLSGVATNCTVGGDNPRTVAVSAGATAETTFAITCEALPPTVGALDLVTTTVGMDLDPDGYTVSVGGGSGNPTGVEDTLSFPGLTPGDYEVVLADVAANCTVGGDNPRTVAVSAGATAETTFAITCAAIVPPPDRIVFSRVTSGLWTINADGSGATQLTTEGNDHTPDVSPDGGTILFSSTNGGIESDIFTTDIDGSNRSQLTGASTAGGESFDPEFSPDGGRIVFHSDRGVGGTLQIWVMDADGSNPVQLTTSGNNAWASWSPDGNQIAFVSNRDGNFEIYVMDDDGANQTRLTNNSAAEFDPAFSPDGTKIVFDSNRNGPGYDVFIMDDDGTDQTRLTTNAANDFYPAWSPDGLFIAFTSDRGGAGTIWVMNADGSNQTDVSSVGNDFFATWVP
jgi:Tol biopolymer transport system component